MPVPDYESFMLPLLRAVAEGAEHQIRDVRDQLAAEFELSPADRAEMLPSGKQTVFNNRFGWAKTYMAKAGLLAPVREGVFRITDAGRAVLADRPKEIDRAFLKQFEPFRAFLTLRHEHGVDTDVDAIASPVASDDGVATPEEQLEGAYNKIRQKVEADVLDAVKAASPQFFEKLVIELLVRMGYGGTIADAGEALGRAGDGGVDGVIKEDKLGLDAIYVQAKRWQNNVGRPEVQGFAGSLLGRRGRKGVFMTTSMFSREAREYVGQIDAKIILIDGPTLAALMVDHDVGVNTVETFTVKRVDSDYFSEE
jgi:restriction system protein